MHLCFITNTLTDYDSVGVHIIYSSQKYVLGEMVDYMLYSLPLQNSKI